MRKNDEIPKFLTLPMITMGVECFSLSSIRLSFVDVWIVFFVHLASNCISQSNLSFDHCLLNRSRKSNWNREEERKDAFTSFIFVTFIEQVKTWLVLRVKVRLAEISASNSLAATFWIYGCLLSSLLVTLNFIRWKLSLSDEQEKRKLPTLS